MHLLGNQPFFQLTQPLFSRHLMYSWWPLRQATTHPLGRGTCVARNLLIIISMKIQLMCCWVLNCPTYRCNNHSAGGFTPVFRFEFVLSYPGGALNLSISLDPSLFLQQGGFYYVHSPVNHCHCWRSVWSHVSNFCWIGCYMCESNGLVTIQSVYRWCVNHFWFDQPINLCFKLFLTLCNMRGFVLSCGHFILYLSYSVRGVSISRSRERSSGLPWSFNQSTLSSDSFNL